MNNFLDFIEKDINAKKALLTTMPIKTKTNIKKKNLAVEEIEEKYEEYRTSVRNYLLAKSKSLEVKDKEENVDKLNEKIVILEHVKFLLNPTNGYFEKMGFDDLLYQINNYYIFNFKSLTAIIDGFLDKFDQAGIKLNSDDFKYTCYVHEYMTAFLEVRNKTVKNYNKVSEIFEQIYWINPEIIEHIELNFRKLIKINHKKFNEYIVKLQKKVLAENNIKNYFDCLEKIQSTYIELKMLSKENVSDIIELAKNNGLDINQYLPDSKVRKVAYESLIDTTINIKDTDKMKKICSALEKLKLNIDEYNNYLEFLPLFDSFKKEYEKLAVDENAKKEYKGLKEIESKINTKEDELEKINKKIFSGKPGLFQFRNDSDLKQLKLESLRKAKDLYDLYKEYDKENFKDKILSVLNSTLTISDLLNLYYSFDYFKKLAIQKVYNINDYQEILKQSDAFDLFAMDPTNIIIDGILVFDECNIPRIIANKYKLNNINVTEESLSPENLSALSNKIMLVLRTNKIEESDTTVEKIWFMVQVEKIIAKESKKE